MEFDGRRRLGGLRRLRRKRRHATPPLRIAAVDERLENELVERLRMCIRLEFRLDADDVRNFIKQYLDVENVAVRRFKNNMPDAEYVDSFLTRHGDRLEELAAIASKRLAYRDLSSVTEDELNHDNWLLLVSD